MVGIHERDEPEHLAADLEELLAEDPRVSEQGLRVTADPPVLRVEGTVATVARRDAVTDILLERLTGWRVDNFVTVLAEQLRTPGSAERIP